jgi:hypothetical protein
MTKETEMSEIVTTPFMEQLDYVYFECPECDFDSVQKVDFRGSINCPM